MEEKHSIAGSSEQMWESSMPFCHLEGCLWFPQVLDTHNKHSVLPELKTDHFSGHPALPVCKAWKQLLSDTSMSTSWDRLFCLRLMQVFEIDTACSGTKIMQFGPPLPFPLFPFCLDDIPHYSVGLKVPATSTAPSLTKVPFLQHISQLQFERFRW